MSIREKNPNDGFIEKYVSARQKINLSPAGVSALARKSVSTTQNEAFIEKYFSTVHKLCFFWQEN